MSVFSNCTNKLYIATMVFLMTAIQTTSLYASNGSDLPTIIVANPTARNIEILNFLTSKKILNIDLNKVQIVGVYHTQQAYDFSESASFIKQNQLSWITLQPISENLTAESVFAENECTPVFRNLFNRSVATFFFGGPDIQPELYGESNLYSVVNDPFRHLLEVSLSFHLTGSSRNPDFRPFLEDRPNYLVTGFCLGMQTMNVAAGGSLWQDIPAQIYQKYSPEETLETDRNNLHRNYWQLVSDDPQLMTINLHSIRFTDHPFFRKRIKTGKSAKPLIYSSHHQSMKDLGLGFEVTALSDDRKIVEAFAHSKYPNVFAVQFHPEVPALYEDREALKFAPNDDVRTMHQILGRRSVRFHERYWKHISDIISNLIKG